MAVPQIQINQNDLEQILEVVGFPVVKVESLEVRIDKIKELYIFPAMREYFNNFPLKKTEEFAISGDFSFDFPTVETMGIIDARASLNNGSSGQPSPSPFVNERYFTVGNQSSHRNKMDGTIARLMERNVNVATANSFQARKIKPNVKDRKVTGFFNSSGILSLTWASYSLSFDDIEFQKKPDVIKLAQSKVARGFYFIRSQLLSNTNSEFNVDALKDTADSLQEEVYTRWKEYSKIVVLRG